VGFIVCHDETPPQDLCEAADGAGVAVLATPVATMKCMSELMLHLEEKLAPSITVHGSLLDAFGVGVLILGDSGIGKSECALALLNMGHRLVADDVVEIRRTPEKTLLGTGIKALRYHMEIRGLGIVDIQRLFGARAVRERKLVDLVVQLVPWEPGKTYDRTGLEEQTHTILDVPLPIHVVPVKTGRNLAVLIEVAAMNFRLKQMGVNPAERLDEAVLRDVAKDAAPPPRRPAPPSRHKRHEER
jgi:HPr kinase/phosphorylase